MDLVLVGGGHAHVQVLREWIRRPVDGARLAVVLDRPEAVYSGMLPGYVAGDYRVEELFIDVAGLANRAGARVYASAASSLDPSRKLIELADESRVRYDVASLDFGSRVRGLELPGVAEHVLATRPIQSFVQRLDAQLDGAGAAPRLVVVGGGVAGTEIAFTLEARLRGAGRAPRVLLVSESDRLLPGLPARLVRRVESEAAARGIVIRTGLRVTEVRSGALRLTGADSEECLACDLVVWATGAAPVAFGSGLPLPKDAAGFVRVRRTLQVEGDDDLFAVGDCASLAGHPTLPKAGVFAVRQGPVLAENLRRRIAGRPLRAYQPQRDYLVLINLGGRRALGTKWGGVVSGRWVWHWKDRIDRRFIAQFR